MDEFFDRISHPALTDVQVNWGGAAVEEVFPARVPDLFVGRPVILTGRFHGKHLPGTLVTGNAGSQRVTIPVPSSATINPALPSVWARMKIAALSDRSLLDNQHGFEADIKRVALDYNLMSAFTAFVAVDSLTQTTGSAGAVTPVAMPVPEGVNYKTTVQE
jgi:Ca-activated chloride channel homolog